MPKWEFNESGFVILRSRYKNADPQQIGDALAELAVANSGRLKATHVVEAARSRTHYLHRFFEWRDKIAAEAYRVDQARMIIRSIELIDEEERRAPAYVSIHSGGTSYRSVVEVLKSPLLREQLLHQARRDLLVFERRYRDFQDLVEAVADVRTSRIEPRLGEESRPSA